MSSQDELSVLVVCTANVSRSPLTAALLSRRLADAGVRATVRSAGVMASRLPVDPLAVQIGRELGVDLADHVPRRVVAADLDVQRAHLVVGHTREHVRELIMVDPSAWDRAFTLKELSRRVRAGRSAILAEPERWKDVVSADRSPRDLLGDDRRDDITDPYGRSISVHRSVAAEIDDELSTLVDGLFAVLATVAS